MLKLLGIVAMAVCVFGLIGCADSGGGTLSKDEVKELRNPQKEMPKEAAEWMAKNANKGPQGQTK